MLILPKKRKELNENNQKDVTPTFLEINHLKPLMRQKFKNYTGG